MHSRKQPAHARTPLPPGTVVSVELPDGGGAQVEDELVVITGPDGDEVAVMPVDEALVELPQDRMR